MYLAAYVLLLLALLCAMGGAGMGAAQLWQGRHTDLGWLEKANLVIAASLTAASAILLHALAVSDFTLEYVAGYTDLVLPMFYKITAFWAGQPGSMLFWALMVSLCGAFFQLTRPYRLLSAETRLWYWVFYLSIMGFFALLITAWSNPFIQLSPAPADGRGMNPLLQNPGMILHPPLLFLGYGGFVIPGCLALAQAMHVDGSEQSWLDVARPFTLTAWLFLTVGIIIGGWWAYMELGWGGYWAWDPVENASLIPWLIGTAAIHTGLLQTRRGKLHRVNTFLMALTTVSAFFATYLVRGNVVNSVHAFGEGGVGPALLIFVLASLVVVIFASWQAGRNEAADLGGLETREGFLVLTAWMLIAIACVILVATLWPVITAGFGKTSSGLSQDFYNRVCLPLFTVIMALLAVCPWLGLERRRARLAPSGRSFRLIRRFRSGPVALRHPRRPAAHGGGPEHRRADQHGTGDCRAIHPRQPSHPRRGSCPLRAGSCGTGHSLFRPVRHTGGSLSRQGGKRTGRSLYRHAERTVRRTQRQRRL